MSAIQHITTLSSIFLTSKFDTGNRMLDNTLIAISVGLIVGAANYLLENWRKLYNCAIFHLYGMRTRAYEISKVPYSIPTALSVKKDEFLANMTVVSALNLENNNHVKAGIRIFMIITELIKQQQTSFIRDSTLTRILSVQKSGESNEYGLTSGIYPLLVASDGTIIYYETTSGYILIRSYAYLYEAQDLLKNIIEARVKEMEGGATTKTGIYTPKISPDGAALQQVGQVASNKTFDSLFYEQKEELIALLEKFKSRSLYPSHVPMENKLGILLYGPPGTGKTGTISAIANMLQRNLVVVNFAEVTKCKHLDKIMEPAKFKENIYVFDEFDCILDALGKAPLERGCGSGAGGNDWGTMLMAAEGDERKEVLKMMREGRSQPADATIDMAYLLQKLDGLVSADDRIIIATTNNPDKINPALLRPGRFDMKLCLGNCTRKMLADILDYYYQGRVEGVRETVMATSIPDGRYSPLEIMNRAMQAPSFEALLAKLQE